jgi:signal transduction histidine kinase
MSLKRESVDCNTLVMDVFKTFRPLTESHQFVLDLDPELRDIKANRDRFSQALTNLVSNAMKYSADGGTVTIATRNDGGDIGPLHSRGRDRGRGERPPRIITLFERVETGMAGRIAGTGLGLAIVQEITSLHEDQIWAESEPGIGSTLHLVVPTARSHESRSRNGEESRS